MADYACAFSQLESGKYFERIIISFIRLCSIPFFTIHLGFSNPLRPFAIIHNNLFMRKCRVKMVKAQYHGTPFLRLMICQEHSHFTIYFISEKKINTVNKKKNWGVNTSLHCCQLILLSLASVKISELRCAAPLLFSHPAIIEYYTTIPRRGGE